MTKMAEKTCDREVILPNDYTIIRTSFHVEEFKSAVAESFNLTFLCWCYFLKLLKEDFNNIKDGRDMSVDDNDLASFLFRDIDICLEIQREIAAYNVYTFKKLCRKWIGELFHNEYFVCTVVCNKGLGIIAKVANFGNISSTLFGYAIQVPLDLFGYLVKCGYSSTMCGGIDYGLVVFGVVSIVNHECKCSFTFKFLRDGRVGITRKERLTVEGIVECYESNVSEVTGAMEEDSDADEIAVDISDSAYLSGSEIVVAYQFETVKLKTFNCYCCHCMNNDFESV
jgi:hypothetical protein